MEKPITRRKTGSSSAINTVVGWCVIFERGAVSGGTSGSDRSGYFFVKQCAETYPKARSQLAWFEVVVGGREVLHRATFPLAILHPKSIKGFYQLLPVSVASTFSFKEPFAAL